MVFFQFEILKIVNFLTLKLFNSTHINTYLYVEWISYNEISLTSFVLVHGCLIQYFLLIFVIDLEFSNNDFFDLCLFKRHHMRG